MRRTLLLLSCTALAACVPKKVHEEPIMENDQRVEDTSATEAAAGARADYARQAAKAEKDSLQAEALATCAPAICDAVMRGEVAIGMTRTQVLAATGTTRAAWSIRGGGDAAYMTPARSTQPPTDAVGNVVLVQLASGQVSRYAYQEPQGMRMVSSPADATTEGRAKAMAEALVREGDELAAVGDFDRALDRYDRASVLDPGDPMIDYKVASVLDRALHPNAALIQYRLFLHRLELEKIEARGEAAARMAEAIALAQQRIVVLEKQVR